MELIIHNSVDKAYREVGKWLDQYMHRIGSENRFLCSYGKLRSRFPEFGDEVLTKVWERLKTQGRVKLDPMDGEWILAKG